MKLKRHNEFLNENNSNFNIEFVQDFSYENDDFKGEYSINGEDFKTEEEEDFNMIKKISNIIGVKPKAFMEWFYSKFDFDFYRASEFNAHGKKNDLNSIKAEAFELD